MSRISPIPPLAPAFVTATILVGTLVPTPALGQNGVTPDRPIPGPVVPPPFYRTAIQRGTRTADGRPGPTYWQPHTRYQIEARLEPETGQISGQARIQWQNESPHTLNGVIVNLYQNLHAPGAVRNEAQEVTGGVTLTRVTVAGSPVSAGSLADGPGYAVDGTLMAVRPPDQIEPGDTLELEVDWTFVVPQNGAGRMGHSDREVYFLAYWFPKMAVLDDLRGWDAEPYMAGAEFYDGFGDYRVSLDVPAGWTVMATGELLNADEVLSPQVRDRLAAAASADTIVRVASAEELGAGTVTTAPPSGRLVYHFAADTVRDFTWTASNVQTWDATSAVVPDRDGDGADDRVLIHAFWRAHRAPLWDGQALFGKHAIEHHSRYTGFAYPWPHMTSVEGSDIIDGGMEFPMLTLIGGYQGQEAASLYNVTSHELAHMWIPMIVGTNERRHAWMDEGSTTFLEDQGRPEYWPGTDAHASERESYLMAARTEMEKPLMTHGDLYGPGFQYGVASYPKPATLLLTLRGLLGDETFERAYRSFIADWAFKHPSPWDLFNAVEREAGEDLDWFWNTWYYETWALDQAVADVEQGASGPVITVEDRGFAPMPVLLRVETTDGGVLEREVGVEAWLSGETSVTVSLPADVGRVVRVEIDPEFRFPDVDRSNNTWVSDAGGP